MGYHDPRDMTRDSEFARLTGKMPLTEPQANAVLKAAGIKAAVTAATLALQLRDACGVEGALEAVRELLSRHTDNGFIQSRLRRVGLRWEVTGPFGDQLNGAKQLLELLRTSDTVQPAR